MFLKDIKVSAKIVATLTLLSGTILGIGITGIDGMQHGGDTIGKIYRNYSGIKKPH